MAAVEVATGDVVTADYSRVGQTYATYGGARSEPAETKSSTGNDA